MLKTTARHGVINPPRSQEPEMSFFPAGERSAQLSLLKQFPTHMDRFLRVPEPEKRRRFREYSITFALSDNSGKGSDYNYRMRAFLQPMSNGRVEITNWQLTVKTKGNAISRKEYETVDNLPQSDLVSAFEELKRKYGSELPQSVQSVNPNDLFVGSICLNARHGHNGLFRIFDDAKSSGSALIMANADDVLFTAPQILDRQGKVIQAGRRPEAEIEIKNISGSPQIDEVIDVVGEEVMFTETIEALGQNAKGLFPQLDEYETSKVDEAQRRVQGISHQWSNWTNRVYMKPDFYTSPDMQHALRALIDEVSSPYVEGHAARLSDNERIIEKMRATGQRVREENGYTRALLAT